MDDDRLQKNNNILYIIFLVSGLLMIVSSFYLSDHKILDLTWTGVLLNVGASLIATAGISFLYQKFGTNALDHYLERLLKTFLITESVMKFGIQEMWSERKKVPRDKWNTFTKMATSEVWLMGMAEFGFADDSEFHEIVSDGTAKGCNYRFLLLNPDSDAAKEVDKYEGDTGELLTRIRLSLQKFSQMRAKNQKKQGKIEIRIYDNAPQVSIIRSDDQYLITPYTYYLPGNSNLTLLIHKTPDGISDHYLKFFIAVWDAAQPV